jgi:hypothetical protein
VDGAQSHFTVLDEEMGVSVLMRFLADERAGIVPFFLPTVFLNAVEEPVGKRRIAQGISTMARTLTLCT